MYAAELNQRSKQIFSYIVEDYLRAGQPIGSKQVLDALNLDVSSATIRNVMAQLETRGLLYAPHISAGRLPTEAGLKFYIDGLMEIGDIDQGDKEAIDEMCADAGTSLNVMLERASHTLSGLSEHLGMVMVPKQDSPIKQIQFMRIADDRALAVLVGQDDQVENRLISISKQVSNAELTRLSNFLNDVCAGQTIAEIGQTLDQQIYQNRLQLDDITKTLVTKGLAVSGAAQNEQQVLIIKGQSKLLEDVQAMEDIDRARDLFALIEDQQRMMNLINSAGSGDGVKIYLGAENDLFNQAGWSMMIAPYKNADHNVIGALGVIGPSRLNYGRIIPILDYTARVITRLIG